MGDQVLGDLRAAFVHGQQQGVGIEAGLLEHLAADLDSDGEWQDGARVRLDDHWIAGGQAGENAGITVPGGEGRAADGERHAARHDTVDLFHDQRVVLALRLGPDGGCRRPGHFGIGIGDGLETAVLGVRAAGLKGHHEGLAGGLGNGVGHFETGGVEALQNLQADTDPVFDGSSSPAFSGFGCRIDQQVDRGAGILDIERGAKG